MPLSSQKLASILLQHMMYDLRRGLEKERSSMRQEEWFRIGWCESQNAPRLSPQQQTGDSLVTFKWLATTPCNQLLALVELVFRSFRPFPERSPDFFFFPKTTIHNLGHRPPFVTSSFFCLLRRRHYQKLLACFKSLSNDLVTALEV